MKSWIRNLLFYALFPSAFVVGAFGCMFLGQITPIGWCLFPLILAFEFYLADWWVHAENKSKTLGHSAKA